MKLLYALTALVAVLAAPVYADCSYPTPPDKIPDGATATKEEMIAAHKVVQDFNQAINAYVACIKLEYDSQVKNFGDKPSDDQKADMKRMEQLQIQKNNAAIDQAQSVADRFNQQVRIFKARSADDTKK